MYLNKLKLQKNLKKFKNRKLQNFVFDDNLFSILNNFYIFSNYTYVFIKNKLFIELKLYRYFFLKLRRLSKKKKFKTYVMLCCNHCFSKKSQNSRMGKGKGKFLRYVFRYKTLKPIFMFKLMSKSRITKFTNFLNKKNSGIAFSH